MCLDVFSLIEWIGTGKKQLEREGNERNNVWKINNGMDWKSLIMFTSYIIKK